MFNQSFQQQQPQRSNAPPPVSSFSITDLQQYLQEKRVEDLFVSLMQSICLERPSNVVSFLQQKLQQIESLSLPQTQQQPHHVVQQVPVVQQKPKPTFVQPQTKPPTTTTAPSTNAKSPSPFSWDDRTSSTGSVPSPSSSSVEKPKQTSAFSFNAPSPSPSIAESSQGIDWNESENRRRRYSISVARRRGVSSEILDETKPFSAEELKVHLKTPEQTNKLREALANNALFMSLDPEDLKIVLDAMFEVSVAQGDVIIRQGDEQGDLFYVIYSGECEATKKINNEEKVVKEYGSGDSFGELALIYGTPRAATVRAKSDCKLYAINRVTFRRIVMMNTKKKREMYEDFLKRVPILETLTDYERMTVADALVQETYDRDADKGRYIIKQGDRGEAFYILIEGEVVVRKKLSPHDDKSEEIELTKLGVGDYFGEIALLTDQPRQASVVIPEDIEENVKVVKLSRRDFKNLLGPCEEILKRNMKLYNQYVTATQI